MARIKTRYVGVYFRIAKKRIMANGKPDVCYDIHYTAHGKDIWEKVGWRSEGYSLQDAIAIRGMRVKTIRHPELHALDATSEQQVTISELWEKYCEICLPNLRNKKTPTLIYNNYIGPRFSGMSVDSITKLDIDNFKNYLIEQPQKSGINISKAYVNQIISFLRRLINKGILWDIVHIPKNPAQNMAFSDADKSRERFLSESEASKLLDGLKLMYCDAYFFAKISLFTGMRLSEVAMLERNNINLDSKIIYIEGKTGYRSVYIPDNLIPLFEILKRRNSSIYGQKCFNKGINTISRYFRLVINAIGLNDGITDTRQKVVFHTLRHTFCSWLAIKGIPIYTIGELVGHKEVRMTQRYAKLSPDTKRDALRKISNIL